MAFRWRADDGPILNAGLVALKLSRGSGPILLKILYFCDFPGGGGGPPCPPSGSAHDAMVLCSLTFHTRSLNPKSVHRDKNNC